MNIPLRIFEFCCSCYIGYMMGKALGLDSLGVTLAALWVWSVVFLFNECSWVGGEEE